MQMTGSGLQLTNDRHKKHSPVKKEYIHMDLVEIITRDCGKKAPTELLFLDRTSWYTGGKLTVENETQELPIKRASRTTHGSRFSLCEKS